MEMTVGKQQRRWMSAFTACTHQIDFDFRIAKHARILFEDLDYEGL